MRFVPNHLKIEIQERTPVAFARLGSKVVLVDRKGTLMELPSAQRKKFSFPVIVGMNPGEPLSTRASRMKIYNELVAELDSGGARYSQDLSEVDLSDPDDVKVVANDPAGAVLIHLGNSDYLSRYKIYVAHVREWRQQFDKVESVDLRYDRQIIVNPDLHGALPEAASAKTTPELEPASLKTVTKPVKKSAPPRKKGAASKQQKPSVTAHKSAAVAQDTVVHPSVANSKKPSPGIAKQQETP
jgi:cell division protein FtsQ